LGELELTGTDPADYLDKARSLKLTPAQERFLNNSRDRSRVLSSLGSCKDKTPIRFSRVDRLVLEGLFVLCRLELDKGVGLSV
jgi:hypothetical protein